MSTMQWAASTKRVIYTQFAGVLDIKEFTQGMVQFKELTKGMPKYSVYHILDFSQLDTLAVQPADYIETFHKIEAPRTLKLVLVVFDTPDNFDKMSEILHGTLRDRFKFSLSLQAAIHYLKLIDKSLAEGDFSKIEADVKA